MLESMLGCVSKYYCYIHTDPSLKHTHELKSVEQFSGAPLGAVHKRGQLELGEGERRGRGSEEGGGGWLSHSSHLSSKRGEGEVLVLKVEIRVQVVYEQHR